MIDKIFKNQLAQQTFTYYISRAMELLLGLVHTIILTRFLLPNEYGIVSVFMAVVGLSLSFFLFGFMTSSKYSVANSEEKEAKKLLGASFVIACILGILFALAMFLLSFFIDRFYQDAKIGAILLRFSPLLAAFIFRSFMLGWGEGTNKIIPLSIFVIIMKIFELVLLSVFFFVLDYQSINSAIFCTFITPWIFGLGFIYYLKPSFENLLFNMKKIWTINKEFGLKVFIGQVAGQTTYRLDKVLIPYFVNATVTGYYSLADMGLRLVIDLPYTLSSSSLRKFASQKVISEKIFRVTIIWLLSSLLGIYLFGPKLIEILLSEKYIGVTPFLYPLGIAAFFQGLYQPFNAFFISKGMGNQLRAISFTEASLNIVTNILFIKYYGAMGACWSSALVKFVDFIIYIIFYKKYIREKVYNRI